MPGPDAYQLLRRRQDIRGIGLRSVYRLFANGNRLARCRKKFVTSRCLAEYKFQVLGKEVAFNNEALSRQPCLFKVTSPARIAFGDRSARIACSYAVFWGRRERDCRTHQARQSVGRPHLEMARVPARIGRQRHGQIWQTNTDADGWPKRWLKSPPRSTRRDPDIVGQLPRLVGDQACAVPITLLNVSSVPRMARARRAFLAENTHSV